ncbi:hypothetical protein CHS0354_020455 [Potamilus streckersoni]|uniref:Mitochondria-eating protein C-terminal domain-containing protein n=1 Tax=Potamilus streckersoni TaxID=2493646 RepID=A0AAE0TAW7_9BIVA|nr:hypothetical protein CHS0354_020455 [Potamilus streckersoni]
MEVISAVQRPSQAHIIAHPASGVRPDYDAEAKSESLYRRSENAAILLRDNNPNITDLSDRNRPTLLAERFSELYSNEYTDAFEELEKSRYREGAIIYHLLRVVRLAFEHCHKWNSKIEHELKLEQNEISKLDHGKILFRGKKLEEKKIIVIRQKDMVVQDFMETTIPTILPQKITPKAELQYKRYSECCVEILWWMCVQNPPIHLDWLHDRPKNQAPEYKFDSNLYRSYTLSGEYVDFCVWPLVRLHKNGPILSKGIAQGMHK